MTRREIKELRSRLKMTQGEFAKAVGLKSFAWISAIENGRVRISSRLQLTCELLEQKSNNVVDIKV